MNSPVGALFYPDTTDAKPYLLLYDLRCDILLNVHSFVLCESSDMNPTVWEINPLSGDI
jgi:hypothetical protein